MQLLDRLNIMINNLFLVLGGISVLALMTLATANVVLRLFNMPFQGTYEIVSFLGAITIAFALGYTQKTNSNIVVDIVSERYPASVANVVDKLVHQCVAIFFGLVTWQVCVYAMKIHASNEVSETIKIIYYPFVFAVAVGFAALSFTAFVDFLKSLFPKEDSK